MPPPKPWLRWAVLHLLIFLFSPLSFMLAGLVAGGLLSIEPYVFSASSSLTFRHQSLYNQALYLLAPLLTGLILGSLVSWSQYIAMRKTLPGLPPLRWILFGAFGMGLACPAFAWAFSSPVFDNPLLFASLFGASVFGLTCALPQSHLLRSHTKDTWRWLFFSTLAILLSYALICAPVWLPESSAYFFLVFLCSAAGGALFGSLTGVEFKRWSENRENTKKLRPESQQSFL